jgi:hypothetical protein
LVFNALLSPGLSVAGLPSPPPERLPSRWRRRRLSPQSRALACRRRSSLEIRAHMLLLT